MILQCESNETIRISKLREASDPASRILKVFDPMVVLSWFKSVRNYKMIDDGWMDGWVDAPNLL